MASDVLSVFDNAEQLAAAAIDMAFDVVRKAIIERRIASIVLSGGSTPETMYKMMSRDRYRNSIDWSSILIFMGDERFVPYEDARSNFGMVRRTLLNGVEAPSNHVFPILTNVATPEAAAHDYEQLLRQKLPYNRFDLAFLGLGEDGHTASLFPGKFSLQEKNRWAIATPPGTLPPPVDRITLTYPILNAARNIYFLVTGEKKAAALKSARDPNADFHKIPAAGIRPHDGNLVWLVDRAAANE